MSAPLIRLFDQKSPPLSRGKSNQSALAAEAFAAAQWLNLSAAGRSLSQLGARLAASDPALAALVRERQDLAREWSRLDAQLLRSITQPQAARTVTAEPPATTRRAAIEGQLATIDADLAARFPAFAALGQPAPLEIVAAQQLLKPNEVLLQFVVGEAVTHVWAVTRDAVDWHRIATTEAEIARQVETLRCGLDASRWQGEGASRCRSLTGRDPAGGLLPFDSKSAYAVWQKLLGPVTERIRGRTLLIVASGHLATLPFQVLLTAPAATTTTAEMAKAPWLLRSHAVAIFPTVGSLAALRRQVTTNRAAGAYLGIGNPLLTGPDGTDTSASAHQNCPPMPQSKSHSAVAAARQPAVGPALLRSGAIGADLVRRLEPLPETTDEICAVARRLGGDTKRDVLLGPDATETRVKAESAGGALATRRIIHFATHGLVAGEIAGLSEPALVLSPPAAAHADDDGLLTASEVATLRLNADVVVLSACNTAAGDGKSAEALSGLARAFFYAGARSLIVSHWPVDSDAAVRLVVGSFDVLRTAPSIGRAEALRRAMIAILDDPRGRQAAHPQIWAPFVIVGEDGSSDLTSSAALSRASAPSAAKRRTPASGQTTSRKAKPPPAGSDIESVFRELR